MRSVASPFSESHVPEKDDFSVVIRVPMTIVRVSCFKGKKIRCHDLALRLSAAG